MAGIDPFSLVSSGLQTLGGIFQMATAHPKRYERQLENLNDNSPKYVQNKSILDYYNKALQKYGTGNATDSSFYKNASNNIQRNTAQGLGSLRGAGNLISGASRLTALQNDAMANAGVKAEQMQNQNLSQLGSASSMKAGEDRMAFNINKQQPFERKYNLLAQKAAQAAQQKNQGMQNIFGGVSGGSTIFGGRNRNQNNNSNSNSIYDEGAIHFN